MMHMNRNQRALVAIVSAVAAVAGIAWGASALQRGESPDASSADIKFSPTLTSDMIDTLAKHGVTVTPDVEGTGENADGAARAADAGMSGFGFVNPENVKAVSLATVTIDDREQITDRTLWVVYLEGVHQPLFGSDETLDEGVTATMYILVDPETMKFVTASSF